MQRIICAKSRKDWIRWLEYCHQECVAKQEREREVFESDNIYVQAALGNCSCTEKTMFNTFTRFATGQLSDITQQQQLVSKGRINESYNVRIDCAQQAQVWSMQRCNCVCVCAHIYFLRWSLPLRSSSNPNKSRHDSLQLISCPTTELSANGAWFNSGNNSSPKKRLFPTQPHDTVSLGPIRLLAFFWGGEFSAYQVTPPTRSSKIHLMGGNS